MPASALACHPHRETACGSAASDTSIWRIAEAASAIEGSAIRAVLKLTENPEILSFAGGLPNPLAFPVEAIRAAGDRILRDDPGGALQYGPTEGYGPLREQIAARLSVAGQPTAVGNVLITSGSQQGLDLIGKALLEPGATVLADNPGYLGAFQAFALYRPRFADLHSAGDLAPAAGAAFAYATPNFANPTGATLSLATRQALVARLGAAGIPLVEDDPYGELWFDAPPPPGCRALAPEMTLRLGSFSKILTPGLRVGYVAGPVCLIELLSRLKQAADLQTPSLNQRLVSALMTDGTLADRLPALRALYRRQRDALLAALTRHLSNHADWQVPAGGMFAWLRLKNGGDAGRLLEVALRHRVAFVPGAPFHFQAPDASTLRLAFSTLPAERMDEGIAALAAAIEISGA